MAVRTPGAAKMFEGKSFSKRLGRLYYKLFGKDVEEIVVMIAQHVNTTTTPGLYAFKQTEVVPLTMSTFNEANASKLSNITAELVK